MKYKYIFPFLIASFFSFGSFVQPHISVEIPKDYSGWVEIVGSSKLRHQSRIILDAKGVGYMDTATLNGGDVQIDYYQNAIKLTPSNLKFFFAATITPKEYMHLKASDKDYITHKRGIYGFYVLSKEELQKGDSYWDDENNLKGFQSKSKLHTDSLIVNGSIKVE